MPTDLRKPAHGPSRTLKSGPRRTPEASPSTLRAALGSPEELPGAAKPRICKRLQREHQLRPPSWSTWNTWAHPAPPVDSTMFRRSTLVRSRLPALSGLPSRRTRGVGGFDWAAPTAADPERGSCGQQFENGPLRFRLRVLRRRVQPGRVMLNQDESCSRHLNQLPRNAQNSRSQALPPRLERA